MLDVVLSMDPHAILFFLFACGSLWLVRRRSDGQAFVLESQLNAAGQMRWSTRRRCLRWSSVRVVVHVQGPATVVPPLPRIACDPRCLMRIISTITHGADGTVPVRRSRPEAHRWFPAVTMTRRTTTMDRRRRRARTTIRFQSATLSWFLPPRTWMSCPNVKPGRIFVVECPAVALSVSTPSLCSDPEDDNAEPQ